MSSSKEVAVIGKVVEKKFNWTEESTRTFLRICIEYQKVHGVDQPFSWVEISSVLENQIGRKCPPTKLKNKLDHMKKLYKLWKDLRHGETGIGWDPIKGRITADDAWWEKKIKEREDYKQFRKRGVAADLEDLWEQVFSGIVATGQHCVTPSMDPCFLIQGGEIHKNDEGDEELANEEGENSDSEFGNLNTIDFNAPDDELLRDIQEQITSPNPSTNTKKCAKAASKSGRSTPSAVGSKRRKKGPTSAQMYSEHLAIVEQTSQKMLTLFEAEAATSATPQEKCTFQHVMEILEEMVKEELVEEDSTLWCFATAQLMNESFRKMFINIPRHAARLAFLKYQYVEIKGVSP